MNWTGGKLNQRSKSNSHKTVTIQKGHFAKARLEAQRNLINDHPYRFSSLTISPPRLTENVNNSSTQIIDRSGISAAERVPVRFELVRPNTTYSRRLGSFAAPKDSTIPTTTNDRTPMLGTLPLQTQRSHKRSVSRKRPNNSLEARTRSLLSRSNWLGIAAAKPLRIESNPQNNMQRIGRHRKLNRTAETKLRSPDGEKSLKCWETLHEPRASKDGKNEDGDNYVIGRQSDIVRPQVTAAHGLSQNSILTRNLSVVSTRSLLIEGLECFVEDQKQLRTAPSPHKDSTHELTTEESCSSKMMALNTFLECSSFDEVVQLSSWCSNQPTQTPNAPELANGSGIPHVQRSDLAPESSPPASLSSVNMRTSDSSKAVSVHHFANIESSFKNSLQAFEKHMASDVRGISTGPDDPSRKPSGEVLKHDRTSVAQRSRSSTVFLEAQDSQIVKLCTLIKPLKPKFIAPSSSQSFPHSITFSQNPFDPIVPQTEYTTLPRQISDIDISSGDGTSASNRHTEKHHLASGKSLAHSRARTAIVPIIQTAPKLYQNTSSSLKSDCSVNNPLVDDSELWIKHVFAEEFEHVQRSFELPSTPIPRQRTICPIEKARKIGWKTTGSCNPSTGVSVDRDGIGPYVARQTGALHTPKKATCHWHHPSASPYEASIETDGQFSNSSPFVRGYPDGEVSWENLTNDNIMQGEGRFMATARLTRPMIRGLSSESVGLMTGVLQSQREKSEHFSMHYAVSGSPTVSFKRPLFPSDYNHVTALRRDSKRFCSLQSKADLRVDSGRIDSHMFNKLDAFDGPHNDAMFTGENQFLRSDTHENLVQHRTQPSKSAPQMILFGSRQNYISTKVTNNCKDALDAEEDVLRSDLLSSPAFLPESGRLYSDQAYTEILEPPRMKSCQRRNSSKFPCTRNRQGERVYSPLFEIPSSLSSTVLISPRGLPQVMEA